MNSVNIIGNLGQDPMLRHVASGKPVLNFRIAVDKSRTSKHTTMSDTSWFDVTVWGAAAEYHAKYLTKGSRVALQGELNQRSWQDRDGNKRSATEIIAHRIEWVKLKPNTSSVEQTL